MSRAAETEGHRLRCVVQHTQSEQQLSERTLNIFFLSGILQPLRV